MTPAPDTERGHLGCMFHPRPRDLTEATATIDPVTGGAYVKFGGLFGDLAILDTHVDPRLLADTLCRLGAELYDALNNRRSMAVRLAIMDEAKATAVDGLPAARESLADGVARTIHPADVATLRQAEEDDALGRAEQAGVLR